MRTQPPLKLWSFLLTDCVSFLSLGWDRHRGVLRIAIFFEFSIYRDNGELPLKNDEFVLKNDRLFRNSRYVRRSSVAVRVTLKVTISRFLAFLNTESHDFLTENDDCIGRFRMMSSEN